MVELIVSVALATFVVIGLYGVFTIQSRQLMTQDMRMEMNQNGRFAMEILSRSIRMAGFGSTGLIYGEMGLSGDGDSLPVVISSDSATTNGGDAITVAYMEPSLVMDTTYSTIEACGTTTITFNPNHLDNFNKLMQFRAGDLLMCQDYAAIGAPESYLWSIDTDAASSTPYGTINISTAASSLADYTTVCPSGENLTPIMRCSKGQVITFYIDDTDDAVGPGTPAHPVLMMDLNRNYPNNDDVPLVDNVEDLQFQYCVDTGGGDTTNCRLPVSWSNSVTSTEITNLWAVRISLTIRSHKENPEGFTWSNNVRPALANNSAGTTADGYYRNSMTTEVTVRNLRMLSSN